MDQIRLMKYDRSKILSEQVPGLGFSVPGGTVEAVNIIANPTEENIDNLIGVISSLLQVIPGIGTLAGTIIEILHGISYFYRYYNESDETKKWEYFILGLVQFGLALVPVPGGNPLIKTIKGEFKKVKWMTPKWLLSFLGMNTLTLLKPPSLKSLIWLFIKKMGINISAGEISKTISIFATSIDKVCEKLKGTPYGTLCTSLKSINNSEMVKVNIKAELSGLETIENEANEIENSKPEIKAASRLGIRQGNSSITFDDASDFEIPVDKCLAYKKWDSSNDKANAGTIQQLMIDLGHKISLDGDFGNETATAVGTYVYGYSKGVRSVDDLWKQMKKSGLGVGETTGYGPKMVLAVPQMLSNIVNTDKRKINC